MKTRFFVGALVVLSGVALAVSAQNQKDAPQRDARPKDSGPSDKGPVTDQEYIARLHGWYGGMASAAELAEKRGGAEVRALARDILRDNKAGAERFTGLAKDMRVELAPGPGRTYQADLDRLGKLEGAEFDRAYIQWLGTNYGQVSTWAEGRARTENAGLREYNERSMQGLRDYQKRVRDLSGRFDRPEPAKDR